VHPDWNPLSNIAQHVEIMTTTAPTLFTLPCLATKNEKETISTTLLVFLLSLWWGGLTLSFLDAIYYPRLV